MPSNIKISELNDFVQTKWSVSQTRKVCTALLKHLPAIIEAYDTNTPIQQKTIKDLYFYIMDRHKGINDESKPQYQLHSLIFTKFGIPKPKHRTYAPEDFHSVPPSVASGAHCPR